MIRKILHAILVSLAVIPWLVAVNCGVLCLILVVLADKVWPSATWGNCWAYVGPKWFKHGGYLLIRYADDIRLLGKLRIPHAIWLKTLGDNYRLEQTVPINRSKAKKVPWRVFYFPFTIREKERDHGSDI
jgi:hypothetical protein